MSAVEYLNPLPIPSRFAPLAAVWRKLLTGRSPWGFADQVLISGTNFATMIFAARGLGKTGFGEFSLVYNMLLFVNLVQVAMVSQPHNVLGTGRGNGKAYASYTASTAVEQLSMLFLQFLIAGGFVLTAHLRGWHYEGLLLALVPAMIAWALQEFFRRILYTEGRMAAAFVNDIISYGGQAVWIIGFWWLDLGKPIEASHLLTGPSALYILAITSGAAALLGCWQVRKSLFGAIDLKVWAENWNFGKWLVGSEVLVYCSSLPMYMNLVGWLVGAAASGELKAAQTLFGPARIISYYLATVLPIQFSRHLAAGGDEALRQAFRASAVRVLPIVGVFCLMIALFAGPLLAIFGKDFAAQPLVLAMYALVAFFAFIQMVLSAALTAKRMTRYVFIATAAGAIVTVFVSFPLIKVMGIYGALFGMLSAGLAITAMLWRGYRSSFKGNAPGGFPLFVDASPIRAIAPELPEK